MVAIESLRDSLGDRLRAKIIREHRRPRNRLQKCPVRTRRRHERDDHKHFAEPDEHRIIVCEKFHKVKVENRGGVPADRRIFKTKLPALCRHAVTLLFRNPN